MEDREADDEALVQAGLNILGEHFDTVQIFVTRHEMGTDDGTVAIVRGCGNWYARLGQIQLWLTQMDENTRVEERAATDD